MSEPAKAWLTGKWYRGQAPDTYRLEAGYLKPVEGTNWVEYDPFEPRVGLPLYEQLSRVNLDSEEALCRLLNRWGPLGLFPHRILQVAYRMGPEDSPGPVVYFTGELSRSVWEPERRFSTVVLETPGGVYRELPAAEIFSRYYPDRGFEEWRTHLRSPFALGLFGDLGMFDGLCEPIGEVRAALLELRECAALAAKGAAVLEADRPRVWTGTMSGDYDGFQGFPNSPERVQETIARHTRRVQEVPVLNGELRWVRAWAFPSLLAASYALLRQDLIGDRLRSCAKCGRPFTVGAEPILAGERIRGKRADAKYCSTSCSTAVKEQNRRAKANRRENPQ